MIGENQLSPCPGPGQQPHSTDLFSLTIPSPDIQLSPCSADPSLGWGGQKGNVGGEPPAYGCSCNSHYLQTKGQLLCARCFLAPAQSSGYPVMLEVSGPAEDPDLSLARLRQTTSTLQLSPQRLRFILGGAMPEPPPSTTQTKEHQGRPQHESLSPVLQVRGRKQGSRGRDSRRGWRR